ncbi:hypothetical protein [Aquimarina algiphila]|uniref:Uncharacterized protein n=1 Tax=Aquimarina algiphila TaxID=2047982 RepID=A0A554VRK0_9FLAO|nr:hypothetical protein [Aquimarina algiphila]TSE11280.1 hypothetical protein FOF46_01230 [Aquimarina algiphila]
MSRKELLRKLKREFEESETLQWFIEVEIKRLTSKGSNYEEIKKLAKLSEEQIFKSKKKKE